MTQVESYSPRRARRSPQPVPPRLAPPSRRSERLDPENDLRGRHATPLGQGFGWVIVWTIVAALAPGAGMVAAGWRRAGSILLGLQMLAGLALAGLALSGGAMNQGIGIAISKPKLLVVALAVAVLGVLWVLMLVLTNTQLRRDADLTRPQRSFSAVLVLALIVGIGLPTYLISNSALLTRGAIGALSETGTGTAPSKTTVDPWANVPRMNVLLIGSDAGSDRDGVRTDSLILASVNTRTGNTVMFSLPRNLMYAQFRNGSPGQRRWPDGFQAGCSPSDGNCMLNAIWTWAVGPDGQPYYKGRNAGLHAVEDAVSGTLQLPVDNYLLLNIRGLVDFVDAIGGVRVNVYQDLPRGGHRNATPDMGAYYLAATQGYLRKGLNKKLDGYNAMWYARSRRGSTDYDRMTRQRCLIGAISEQASPAKVALGFPTIIKSIKKNMATSIGQSDLSAWVTLAERIQQGKITSLAFTDKVINTGNPDYRKIHVLVGRAIQKSDRVASTAPSASAGVTPSAGPSPSSSARKKSYDPTKAQDVQAVC